MICWYGDKITPSIKAVYKISGFDYNIHNPEYKLLDSVADLENKGVHYDAIRKILRDIPLGSQAVFKRYNRATRRFNRVTPSNRGNYKHHLLDNQRKTDRAGVSGQTQSEVPGGNSGSSNAITSDNAQKSSSNIDPNGRYSKDDTIFDDFEDEVVFSEGGVSYEIKYQLFTEKDYYNNSLKLQKMNAVEELTGEEFSYDGTPLNKRVLRYFRELGNNIYSDVFGDVALNNSSVHDDLGHGKTKYKIASFKAVPAVIKKGVVIDRVY